MNLLLLADDEACERQIGGEPADVVLACGDVSDAVIVRIAARAGAAHVLAVKGNHDSSGSFAGPIVDMHLREHALDGIRFGGFAGSWRYKPRGNYLFDQEEVTELMAAFPPVDVFIAHNSPRGIHDRDDEVHFGFDAFVSYIERTKPKLFIHGHQHVNRETLVGDTKIIGIYGFRRLTVSAPAG
jgi:Icc-related predicted phosphoesterase